MEHQVDRAVRQRQLSDYTKILDNEFWHGFLRYVSGEAQYTLRQLASEAYTEQKLRYWQGAYKALTLVFTEYPDRFLTQIRQELDE